MSSRAFPSFPQEATRVMGRGGRRLPHPFRGGRGLSLRYLLCISAQLVLAEGPRANAVRPGGLPLHSRGAGSTASSGSPP